MELHYGIIARDHITTGLYYRIRLWDDITTILRDYITESYYEIMCIKELYYWTMTFVLRNYITGLYEMIILWNCITGLYYGNLLRNDITE